MSDIGHLNSDVLHQTPDVRSPISDTWCQTFKIRRLILETWHQTSDFTHVTTEVWNQMSHNRHLKSDNWHQTSDNHSGKRLKSKLNCEISVKTDSDNTLCNVESAALLGLEIDSRLSFNAHVDKVCKLLASRIAVLQKTRAFLPLSQLVKYYNEVIRHVMSYGSLIWSSCNKEQLYRVLKLQKQAARVILYANRQVSSVPLFNKLSWILFNEQSRMDKCSIIYNHINGTLPIYLNDHIIIKNNRPARIVAMPI